MNSSRWVLAVVLLWPVGCGGDTEPASRSSSDGGSGGSSASGGTVGSGGSVGDGGECRSAQGGDGIVCGCPPFDVPEPPTIDGPSPALEWVTRFGGAGDDALQSSTALPDGSVIALASHTASVTVNGPTGLFPDWSMTQARTTLARFDAAGRGGSRLELPNAARPPVLASDASGRVFVAGEFHDTLAMGAQTFVQQGYGPDPFVAEIDGSGGVVWALAPDEEDFGSVDGLAAWNGRAFVSYSEPDPLSPERKRCKVTAYSDRAVQWQRTGEAGCSGMRLAVTPDGTLYGATLHTDSTQGHIVGIDANDGTERSVLEFRGSPGGLYLSAIAANRDGHVALLGTTNGGVTIGNRTLESPDASKPVVFVAIFSSSGSVEQAYLVDDLEYVATGSMVLLDDLRAIIAGRGDRDFALQARDASGARLWRLEYSNSWWQGYPPYPSTGPTSLALAGNRLLLTGIFKGRLALGSQELEVTACGDGLLASYALP